MDIIDLLIAQGKINLVWVSVAIQGLSAFLKWKLKERFSGLLRFVSIYVSTVALGTIVLVCSKVDFKEAFAVANWLAQAQVAAHQAYKTSSRRKK